MSAFATPASLYQLGSRTPSTRTRHCIIARVAAPRPAQTTKRKAKVLVPKQEKRRAPKGAAKLVVEGDFLESTLLQQLQVYGFFGLTALELGILFTHNEPLELIIGSIIGYLFADLATGVYHWGVDNYGNSKTPILGKQIEAFQGHHLAPWTITRRSFANNLSALTVPILPQIVMLLLLSSEISTGISAYYTCSLLFIVLSQEFHRQAHFIKSSKAHQTFQNLGLVLSRTMHGNHHLSPYGENYCIVSGIWNHVLDRYQIFRRFEKFIFVRTGIQPIAWKLDPELKQIALDL